MFDLATVPQPNRVNAAVLVGVPFDWRLTAPVLAGDAEVLDTYALQLEDTLNTAVILSLFTDRRAGRDDQLPHNVTDRRGWVGDEFMGSGFDARGDEWGSGLWLLTGKATADVLEHARFAVREALAWLVRDGIASRIDVAAEWVGERGDRLAVRPTIYKADQVRPVYDVLWGTSVRKWASA